MNKDKFEACILAGAIGDAWGSSYENEDLADDSKTFYLGSQTPKSRQWFLTDDTQLTLATCEVLASGDYRPENLLKKFSTYYRNNKLTGAGASTVKAIVDYEAGFHWTQTGRTGEFAAGNGAAMRIAPFAFFSSLTRDNIYDACKITHKNDEAFAGALAVFLSIRSILKLEWNGKNNLFDIIIPELPDTNVKDRLSELNEFSAEATIQEAARLGNNGYVVNSVPFAIFCSTKIIDLGLTKMLQAIIDCKGDTDTNASIAGQITGALTGVKEIPAELLTKLQSLNDYQWLKEIVDSTQKDIR